MGKIEDEFVTYDLALRMKQLGFNKPCMSCFFNDGAKEFFPGSVSSANEFTQKMLELGHVPTPTWQSAFSWFRKEYGLSGWVNESFVGNSRQGVISIKSEIGLKYYPTTTNFFDTYEEAQQSCLEKLIEIVEKQKEDENSTKERST